MQTDFQFGAIIAQTTSEQFPPGMLVFAPYRDPPALQPWIHGRHQGKVLAPDTPKVWANSRAFPTARPNRAKIRAWLERLYAENLLVDQVPVLWNFGKIYWERIDSLRPWEPYVAPSQAR